jgi:hypothetical protein
MCLFVVSMSPYDLKPKENLHPKLQLDQLIQADKSQAAPTFQQIPKDTNCSNEAAWSCQKL